MSYDIYLRGAKCPHCGHKAPEPDLPDPTYNLTPIFDLALTDELLPNPDVSEASVMLLKSETDRPRGLRLLNGRVAKSTRDQLHLAVLRLEDPKRAADFRKLEPENKWGDLAGAREVMKRLLTAAETYPEHTWDVH